MDYENTFVDFRGKKKKSAWLRNAVKRSQTQQNWRFLHRQYFYFYTFLLI